MDFVGFRLRTSGFIALWVTLGFCGASGLGLWAWGSGFRLVLFSGLQPLARL